MSGCCDLSGLGAIEVEGRRVGILGLRRALDEVAALGLGDREAIARALLERVGKENWIPPGQEAAYARALYAAYERQVVMDRG